MKQMTKPMMQIPTPVGTPMIKLKYSLCPPWSSSVMDGVGLPAQTKEREAIYQFFLESAVTMNVELCSEDSYNTNKL